MLQSLIIPTREEVLSSFRSSAADSLKNKVMGLQRQVVKAEVLEKIEIFVYSLKHTNFYVSMPEL